MDRLDALQKSRFADKVTNAAELKIDEIEKNLPVDTFPPFKRDEKGNVIEPEKQLEEFKDMLVAIAREQFKFIRGGPPLPDFDNIKDFSNLSSAKIDAQQFIKYANIIADINSLIVAEIEYRSIKKVAAIATIAANLRKKDRDIPHNTLILQEGDEFLPPEIKYYKNLIRLVVDGRFSYIVPDGLKSLKNLQQLHLKKDKTDRNIGGGLTELPRSIEKLGKRLTFLGIEYHRLNSLSLSKFKKLKTLNLEGNQLKTLDLEGMGDLKKLWVADNQLTSLKNLGKLHQLEDLDIRNNKLDHLDLTGMTELRELRINGNPNLRINSSVIDCQKLEKILCDDDQLAELPLELAQCENLTIIYVKRGDQFPIDVWSTPSHAGTPAISLKEFIESKWEKRKLL